MPALRLRWSAECGTCGAPLAAGERAVWDASAKTAHCLHHDIGRDAEVTGSENRRDGAGAPHRDGTDEQLGSAGRSAMHQYERRSERERNRKEAIVSRDETWRREIRERRPLLGRVHAALTPRPVMSPESQATTAWKTGAAGEQRVAEVLATIDGVVALHDRRIPGSRANIDHLAISAAGVLVIDAKKYSGAIEERDVGSLFRSVPRLYVGGRDQTKLVTGVQRQVEIVRAALSKHGLDAVPAQGVLCFVGGEWPLLRRRPLTIGGVIAVWPLGLPNLTTLREGSAPAPISEIAAALATTLPPAT